MTQVRSALTCNYQEVLKIFLSSIHICLITAFSQSNLALIYCYIASQIDFFSKLKDYINLFSVTNNIIAIVSGGVQL